MLFLVHHFICVDMSNFSHSYFCILWYCQWCVWRMICSLVILIIIGITMIDCDPSRHSIVVFFTLLFIFLRSFDKVGKEMRLCILCLVVFYSDWYALWLWCCFKLFRHCVNKSLPLLSINKQTFTMVFTHRGLCYHCLEISRAEKRKFLNYCIETVDFIYHKNSPLIYHEQSSTNNITVEADL